MCQSAGFSRFFRPQPVSFSICLWPIFNQHAHRRLKSCHFNQIHSMNKPHILLAIAIMTVPLLSAKAQWGQGQAPPQISVSGSAEIKVTPDEVDLNLAVESRDESLATAKADNDQRVAGALEFLKKNGVKDKDIQTDYIMITPVYDDNSGPIDPRTGLPMLGFGRAGTTTKLSCYIVEKTIGIKVTNVAGFDAILSGLITNGVNVVRGVDFRTSQLRKYKDQARAEAIKAAKEKAEAMASALGVKIGKPYSVTVNDWGGNYGWSPNGWGYGGGGGGGANAYQNVSQNGGGGSDEGGSTFAAGQISISASVNVSFLIQ
jgi:uncharacterized protein